MFQMFHVFPLDLIVSRVVCLNVLYRIPNRFSRITVEVPIQTFTTGTLMVCLAGYAISASLKLLVWDLWGDVARVLLLDGSAN